MRTPIYAMSMLALMTSSDMALAHGSGGGTSTYESRSPGIQFNIAPTHHGAVASQAQPVMELSVDGQTVILAITDAGGKPIATEFADAKVFITVKGEISTLYLWPAGGNALSGTGDFSPDADLHIEVTLNIPDREPVRKDFYPFK